MGLQTNVMSYGGNGVTVSGPASQQSGAAKPAEAAQKHEACACRCGGAAKEQAAAAEAGSDEHAPDFSKMTAPQKVAFHKARWDRILG